MKAVDVPQANSLDQVRRVVRAIASGAERKPEVQTASGLSARHIDYHVHAARILGWIDTMDGVYRARLEATALLDTEPGSAAETKIMRAAVEGCDALRRLTPDLLDAERPAVSELSARVHAQTGLAPATSVRRAQTLLAWRDRLLGPPEPSDPGSTADPAPGLPQTRLRSLRVRDFAGIAELEVPLGVACAVTSAPGGGKTSFAEALRFIGGLAHGASFAELLGERRSDDGARQWVGPAGGPSLAVHRAASAFALEVETDLGGGDEARSTGRLHIEVEVPPGADPRLVREELSLGDRRHVVYSGPEEPSGAPQANLRLRRSAEDPTLGPRVPVSRERPALQQVTKGGTPRHVREDVERFVAALAGVRVLRPDPRTLRRPGRPGPTRIGPLGEGFPSALERAVRSDAVHQRLIEHWHHVYGREPRAFTFLRDPLGQILPHEVLDDAWALPSPGWSDSALVFAAAFCAIWNSARGDVLVWDDADLFLTPRSLLRLLADAASKAAPQVILLVRSEATAVALQASGCPVSTIRGTDG